MEIQKELTRIVLRSTVRFACTTAGAEAGLDDLGERLESLACAQAASRDIGITEALAPLIERAQAAGQAQ